MRKALSAASLLIAFGAGALVATLGLGTLFGIYHDDLQAEADDLGQIEQSNTLKYLTLFLAGPKPDFRCSVISYARMQEHSLRELEPDGSVAGIADEAVASALATFDAEFPIGEYRECRQTHSWRQLEPDEGDT